MVRSDRHRRVRSGSAAPTHRNADGAFQRHRQQLIREPIMFRLRVIPVAAAFAAGLALSACSGAGSWDPTDMLNGEWLSPTPTLPSEGKLSLAEGVPGVP